MKLGTRIYEGSMVQRTQLHIQHNTNMLLMLVLNNNTRMYVTETGYSHNIHCDYEATG